MEGGMSNLVGLASESRSHRVFSQRLSDSVANELEEPILLNTPII